MILNKLILVLVVTAVAAQDKKKAAAGGQQTRYGGRPVGGGLTHSSLAGHLGGRPGHGGLGGLGVGQQGYVGQQGFVGTGGFVGRPGVHGGGFGTHQGGFVGQTGIAGQHTVVPGGLVGQQGFIGQPGHIGQQGFIGQPGHLGQGGFIGQTGIAGPVHGGVHGGLGGGQIPTVVGGTQTTPALQYNCAATASTSQYGIDQTCKKFCKAPQQYFGGKYLCCDDRDVGRCPPVRAQCPNQIRGYGPVCCFVDSQCQRPTEKCCYDTCLKHKVCKESNPW